MLQITIPSQEYWDEKLEEFVYDDGVTLSLEHSLLSLKAWESKWHKTFLSKKEKTYEETIDYIKCMTLNKDVDESIYTRLTAANVEEIRKYIDDPMTALVFPKESNTTISKDAITYEVIYYWMIALQIPVEFQEWHLNCLINVIKVCNMKNTPPKKMSHEAAISRNRAINAANKQRYNTRG